MVPKTHKTAVVIIPPESVWEPIQRIRRQYDRQFRRWMPHITLLYPFYPQQAFERMANLFQQKLKGVAPFEIWLKEIRYFQHAREKFTLWLAPEPADAVVTLQHLLWQAAPDCDDTRKFPGGFVPHLSIGQVSRRSQLEWVLRQLQSQWQPVRFSVNSIALIWRHDPPDDVFRVDRTIHFQES